MMIKKASFVLAAILFSCLYLGTTFLIHAQTATPKTLLSAYATFDSALDQNGDTKINNLDVVQLFGFGGPTATPTSTPTIPPSSGQGIWISQQKLAALPTSGDAWNAVRGTAEGSLGSADVSNQDSSHDVKTLAAALYCARTGNLCDKARAALVSAIGTEGNTRWLAVGRNMLSYTIAADILRNKGVLIGSDLNNVNSWLASFLTRELPHNNTGVPEKFPPFRSGSNASAQQGAVYAAIAAYLGNAAPTMTHPLTGQTISGKQHLNRIWNAFQRFACVRNSVDDEGLSLHDSTWRYSAWPENNGLSDGGPCGVNPKGSIAKSGGTTYSIDGAIPNDMRRGSSNFTWPPSHTQYPWVGLEGFVPAALLLHRAGYPAFEVADRAVLRTHEFLWYMKNNTSTDWWDSGRAEEVKHLVNVVYGKNYPVNSPAGVGRTFGFTDWTHPTMSQINN